jgi:hypothetical protein
MALLDDRERQATPEARSAAAEALRAAAREAISKAGWPRGPGARPLPGPHASAIAAGQSQPLSVTGTPGNRVPYRRLGVRGDFAGGVGVHAQIIWLFPPGGVMAGALP